MCRSQGNTQLKCHSLLRQDRSQNSRAQYVVALDAQQGWFSCAGCLAVLRTPYRALCDAGRAISSQSHAPVLRFILNPLTSASASRDAMSQCLLNAPTKSHQRGCHLQICTEHGASSFRHARRSHAFSSSKVASRSSSLSGKCLRASFSHKAARQHQLHAGAVVCQATSDKMVIAITGRSSFVVMFRPHGTHAEAI